MEQKPSRAEEAKVLVTRSEWDAGSDKGAVGAEGARDEGVPGERPDDFRQNLSVWPLRLHRRQTWSFHHLSWRGSELGLGTDSGGLIPLGVGQAEAE